MQKIQILETIVISFAVLESTTEGMFETQKFGKKTSSGEISLDIRTIVSRKEGQDHESGGVSVICWHAAPVAHVQRKPNIGKQSNR